MEMYLCSCYFLLPVLIEINLTVFIVKNVHISVNIQVSHRSGTSGENKFISPGPVEWLVRNTTVTLGLFFSGVT
jgi:hypothetical protein